MEAVFGNTPLVSQINVPNVIEITIFCEIMEVFIEIEPVGQRMLVRWID